MNNIEPTVTLPSGAAVLAYIYESIAELQSQGHSVWLNDEGRVLVWPPINPDWAYVLDCNGHDVAKVLAVDLGRTH